MSRSRTAISGRSPHRHVQQRDKVPAEHSRSSRDEPSAHPACPPSPGDRARDPETRAPAQVGAFERLPPITVVPIPLHGRPQAIRERHAGTYPAHEAPSHRASNGGLAFAVFDHRHHVPVGAASLEDGRGQFTVVQLDVAVDVVDTARFALLEDQLDAAAVVVHVYPAANVAAIAVKRNRLPSMRLVTKSGMTFSGYW